MSIHLPVTASHRLSFLQWSLQRTPVPAQVGPSETLTHHKDWQNWQRGQRSVSKEASASLPRLRNSSQVGWNAAIIFGQCYYQASDVPSGPLAMATRHCGFSFPLLHTSISLKEAKKKKSRGKASKIQLMQKIMVCNWINPTVYLTSKTIKPRFMICQWHFGQETSVAWAWLVYFPQGFRKQNKFVTLTQSQ